MNVYKSFKKMLRDMEAYMKCLIPALYTLYIPYTLYIMYLIPYTCILHYVSLFFQLLCLQKEVKIYEEMEKQSDFSFLT